MGVSRFGPLRGDSVSDDHFCFGFSVSWAQEACLLDDSETSWQNPSAFLQDLASLEALTSLNKESRPLF